MSDLRRHLAAALVALLIAGGGGGDESETAPPGEPDTPPAEESNAGIAFHEYAQVPTYPASHGCVRVPSPEAKYVYRFANIGTAVLVY